MPARALPVMAVSLNRIRENSEEIANHCGATHGLGKNSYLLPSDHSPVFLAFRKFLSARVRLGASLPALEVIDR